MTPEKNCRNCRSSDLVMCLDLGKQPLAGGFLKKEEIATEIRYQLSIFVCNSCALVQIVDPIDPYILFKEYSFSSRTVNALVAHFNELAMKINGIIPKGSKIFEMGSNDGVLLDPLKKLGHEAVGIDISENISKIANSYDLEVYTGKFGSNWLDKNLELINSFDLFISSNSFPHNDDQHDILSAAHRLLKHDGQLILEVMHAGSLFEKLQWDTLYHEHLTFHTLKTLADLCKKNGFFLNHAELIPMHGGSLRAFFGKVQSPASPSAIQIFRYEESLELYSPATWIGFGRSSLSQIEEVKIRAQDLAARGSIAAYGAAGKATMWLNLCEMNYLEYIVDESPFRSGKFMPGVHTPIVSMEEFKKRPTDSVIITAWNYEDEIKSKNSWFQGTWAVPLPNWKETK